MTIVTFANFRSGGKSSLARMLGEQINSSILNFDTERDAEHYNAVNTINIRPGKDISRTEKELILSDDKIEQSISSKSDFLICDLGGYFDPRVTKIKSDFYILPSFDDYESIRETIRTAKYILKHEPRAKIIFVLNQAFLNNKKEKEAALHNFEEQLEINMLDQYKLLIMPKTNLCKKLVNDLKKEEDLIKENKSLEYSYRSIKKFTLDLANEIGFEVKK
jgi:hypothetical protein